MSTRKPYPSDLTALQWDNIEHLFPQPKTRAGRKRTYDRKDIVDAVFYLLRAGCSWRMLPGDFPPWDTVYGYFRRWQKDGTWDRIHDALRTKVRRAAGKKPKPSVAIVDSQTVKGTEYSGPNGYDGGKKGGRPEAVRGR